MRASQGFLELVVLEALSNTNLAIDRVYLTVGDLLVPEEEKSGGRPVQSY